MYNYICLFFNFQDTQGSAKKRPALPEDHFDFDDPENGPSPSKRRMHDEVIVYTIFLTIQRNPKGTKGIQVKEVCNGGVRGFQRRIKRDSRKNKWPDFFGLLKHGKII